MPIFKVGGKIIYFAHVPKCAGTAVERYLEKRFGKLAFLDGAYHARPAARKWTSTSPQHVTAETLASLFPAGFFDASFAIVRHPVQRMISEYHFLRDIERRIPEKQGFSDWLKAVPELLEKDRSVYDNHVRPMYEMLPRGTVCFRLEEGLDRVVGYLDRIAGNNEGPRTIAPALTRHPAVEKAVPTPEDLAIIARLYRRDFEILGYASPGTGGRRAPATVGTAPAAVPALSWSRASVIQEAMWLSPYAAAEPAGHNLLRVIHFDGPCDAAQISNAVNRLVDRHDVLRAVFRWNDGKLFWAARQHETITLIEETEPVDRIAFGLERYDVEHGPLFRFRLLRTGTASRELLCGFHHLIIDGTSWPKLVNELKQFLVGEEPGTPAPDYRDHVAWQERWLQSKEAEPSRNYWREKLKSLPATSCLPVIGGRGAVAHRRGGADFALDERLSKLLREASASHKISPFRIVLAVFTALLARVTQLECVVLATTLTGRKDPMAESMQGPFVNTGIISTHVSADTILKDLLQETNKQVRQAVKHQGYPLLSALRDAGDGPGGIHPALTCAQLTRMPDPVSIKVGDLTITDWREFLPVNGRELAVRLFSDSTGFRIGWIYATHLLDYDGVAQLQSKFELLLQAAIENPDTPLRRLNMLEPKERMSLLHSWNDTDIRFPELAPVHRMFEAQAARMPANVAVIDPERAWTYRDIEGAANRIARLLLREGVRPRNFVVLQMHPSATMIAAELAVMKCGAAFVPVAPEWPENRVATLASRLGPSTLILTESDWPGRMPIFTEMLGHEDPGAPEVITTLDDPIYCIFTSGSTGRPKGAVNCHRGIANNILSKTAFYGTAAEDAVLTTAPGTVDTHVWQFFWPLVCGGRVVIATRPEMVTPTAIASVIQRHSVTVADLVPSIMSDVMDKLGEDVAKDFVTLRLLLVGGEAMRATDAYRLRGMLPRCRIVNSYGPTETAIASVSFELPEDYMDPVPIGRPIHNTRAVILDGTELTPIGMVGELCLGGACMGLGYLDDPEETAKSFIPNPFPELGCATLYRTGDLARMRPDGVIECLGRIDDQIKIRGQRIEPGEVEAALRRHPDIGTAVVWAEGKAADAQLVAGFTLAPGCDCPDAAALRKFLRRELPVHLVPAVFRHMESLPLLPGGKVDRKAVAAAAGRHLTSRRTSDPPRGAFEERLAVLWKEIFGNANIGRDDNFFEDLGGDSLQAMRLVALIEERFGIRAELRWVFEAAELKEMAALVAGACGNKPASVLALQRRYLATWRGWKLRTDGLLFAQNPDGERHPLLWCFQGEHELMQLARALGPAQPLVGMRSGHLLKEHSAWVVDELAAAYADEISVCQPLGPILLGGNCQGGGVAQAVAERLSKMGRRVSLLILLEATSFTSYEGPVALLFGKDSHLNPYRSGKDPLPMFEKAYPAGFTTDTVPGAHGEFFGARNVQALASVLLRLMGDGQASKDIRLDMRILV